MANGGVAGGFLSPSAVTRLRALSRAGMTATCAVHRPATTVGTGGTTPTAWDLVPALSGVSALPCSLRPAGVPSETVTADAVRAASRFDVRFPPDAFGTLGVVPASGTTARAAYAGILPTDRLEITHAIPGVPSPMVLSVLGDQPKSVYAVTYRVLAERVSAGGA